MIIKLIEYEKRYGLPGHVKNGDFAVFPAPGARTARNAQFPRFPLEINNPEERRSINSIEDEILEAVKDEPLVRLEDLDLDAWERSGGNPDFVRRIRKG